MTNATLKLPFYTKFAMYCISIFAIVFALQTGGSIILPILYATIIAILLNPLVNYLVSKKINKILAIAVTVVLAICGVLIILAIISAQVSMLTQTYPALEQKFSVTFDSFCKWISQKFSIPQTKIDAWIKSTQSDALKNLAIGEKISAAGRMLIIGMLLPVYLFMILFYKTLLVEFVYRLFGKEDQTVVSEILSNIKKIIQSFLTGLFFEMIIIAILNSVGLLLLGIEYAIILGITGAVLNVIPYIGGIIAIALPMVIAFVTKDSITYPLLVFGVYMFIQFIDNHLVIPRIVASRVQINALVSVIVVLIGGELWGVAGMFLSIPLTAIIKVICDHIEPLKAWGFLLGNTVPTASKLKMFRQRKPAMSKQLVNSEA